MQSATPIRGIQATRAATNPAQMLAELSSTMQDFRARSESRIAEVESALNDMAVKSAGFEMNGTPRTGGNPTEINALNEAARALISGNQSQAAEHFARANAMTTQSGPDGGYITHDVISSGMTRIMAEISPVYRLARKVTMDHGTAFEEVVDPDAAQASWVGESQSRPKTDPGALRKFRVELSEIYAMPSVSQTLLDQSSINLFNWLQDKVGEAFGAKESLAFHTGDGISKPRGFLTYPTVATGDKTRAWGKFEHVVSGASGGFPAATTSVNPADALVDLVAALKPQYRADAVWLMNRATAAVVRKIKDAEGRHVWVDSLIIGQPDVLLGYPVEISEDMPDLGADTLSIAFGSVSRTYCIIERPGLKYLVDPYSEKPNVLLYSYRRVGGEVMNYEAMKFMKFSAS